MLKHFDKKTLWIAGLIILFAVYLVYTKFFPSIPSNPSAISNPSSPNDSVDTAGWKTYSNETLGYSFKYPADLYALEETANKNVLFFVSQNDATDYDFCIRNKMGTISGGPCGLSSIALTVGAEVHKKNSYKTIKDNYDISITGDPSISSMVKTITDSEGRSWTILGPVAADNQSNLTAEREMNDGIYVVYISAGEKGFATYLKKTLVIKNGDTYDYLPLIDEHLKISHQILSTFKFID